MKDIVREMTVKEKVKHAAHSLIELMNDLYESEELTKDKDKRIEVLEEEINILKKRLQHLFESELIRSFDLVDPQTHEYIRDIKEADQNHFYYPLRNEEGWILKEDPEFSGSYKYECPHCKGAFSIHEYPNAYDFRICPFCGKEVKSGYEHISHILYKDCNWQQDTTSVKEDE